MYMYILTHKQGARVEGHPLSSSVKYSTFVYLTVYTCVCMHETTVVVTIVITVTAVTAVTVCSDTSDSSDSSDNGD